MINVIWDVGKHLKFAGRNKCSDLIRGVTEDGWTFWRATYEPVRAADI